MKNQSQLDRFADVIAALPNDFSTANPLPTSLKMKGDLRHEIYYAPFDHVTATARIVLVGITPGRVQAIAALEAARRELLTGRSRDAVLAKAKSTASFVGPMRRNLIDLLDHVGIANRLGIPSTASIWGADQHLVHFTSALRYPVFEQGKNFAGNGIGASQLLSDEVDCWYASECRELPNALFVPLGSAALWACERHVAQGLLRDRQVLRGLPHPSGANAERVAYFLGRKPREKLSTKARPEPLDAGRELAMRCVGEWA